MKHEDKVAIKNIFDILAQRGAFAADEFAIVGPIYDRLKKDIENGEKQETPKEYSKQELLLE